MVEEHARIHRIVLSVLLYGLLDLSSAQTDFTKVPGGELVTQQGNSHAVCLIDFNGDGALDIFVATGGAQSSLLFANSGDSTFTKSTLGDAVNTRAATWGDYDNDGYLDLFLANCCGESNSLYHNDGAGAFIRITEGEIVSDGGNSHGASWGDFDDDGFLDLFVANHTGNDFLYRNTGNGAFEKSTGSPIVSAVSASRSGHWADFNHDGNLDLFIANDSGEANILYKNLGNGFFEIVPERFFPADQENSTGASWADFDNDGDLDLFVTNIGSADALYENTGDSLFSRLSTSEIASDTSDSQSSGWADIDWDGDWDLFVATGTGSPNKLYLNDSHGNFTREKSGPIATDIADSRACAWGDIDNNGFPDLVVANSDTTVFLYLNAGTSNRWLKIRLEGTISNKAAIGARVSVQSPSLPIRTHEISSQTGAGGQSDLHASLGLGSGSQGDSISVQWPSGVRDAVSDIPAEQTILIAEGRGLVAPRLSLSDSTISDSLESGETRARTFALQNTGNADLDFTITPEAASMTFTTHVDRQTQLAFREAPAGIVENDEIPGGLDTRISPAHMQNEPAELFHFKSYTLKGGYVAKGVGMRTTGSGRISIHEIPEGSVVEAAFLYWTVLTFVVPPDILALGEFNGHRIAGSVIGSDADPCWPIFTRNFSLRADVTEFVSGNGVYELSNFADSGELLEVPSAEGASLVIIYRNESLPTQSILLYEGSDLVANRTAGLELAGFRADDLVLGASLTYIVADGQPQFDERLLIGGEPVADDPLVGSDGDFWDTKTYDIARFVQPGSQRLSVEIESTRRQNAEDCVVWVATVFSVSGYGAIRWLSVAPRSGSVNPNNSLNVQLDYQTRDLNAGQYAVDLRIVSNDPRQRASLLPVNMAISGIPAIQVQERLDLGPALIGSMTQGSLAIANSGTALLEVAIETDTALFVPSVQSLSLVPGERRDIEISFVPVAPGAIEGTLTLTTNDPNRPQANVQVSAEGLIPPQIGLSRDRIEVSSVMGATATETVVLSNSGGSDLKFEISFVNIETPQPNSPAAESVWQPPDLLTDEGDSTAQRLRNRLFEIPPQYEKSQAVPSPGSGTGSDFFSSELAADGVLFSVGGQRFEIQQLDPQTGALVNSIFAPEPPEGPEGLAFDGAFLYYVAGFGFGRIYQIDTQLNRVVEAIFVDEINAIDAMGHSGAFLYALDFTQATIFEIHYPSGAVTDRHAFDFPLGGGLTFAGSRGTIFITNFDQAIYEIDPDTWEVVNELTPPESGNVFGLAYSEALGVLLASNTTNGTLTALDPDDGTPLFSYTLQGGNGLAGDEYRLFVRTGTHAGIIKPGKTFELTLTFDMEARPSGNYHADLTISSNDLEDGALVIPVDLEVTEAPDIFISGAELDFDDQVVGEDTTRYLTVLNLGMEPLDITDLSTSSRLFRVDTTHLSLAPNEFFQLPVTFTPEERGDVSGLLILHTNDPDEPTVEFALTGNGIAARVAPFIRLTETVVAGDSVITFGGSWVDFNGDSKLDLFETNAGNNLLFENIGNGTFSRLVEALPSNDGMTSMGSTWGDFDNDGLPDLFVANLGQPGLLYRNEGEDGFSELAISDIAHQNTNARSAAWADYDNDGYLDLFVTVDGADNRLYHNEGNGAFSVVSNIVPVNDGGNSQGCAWADFDNDGDLDLFVANGGEKGPENNFLYDNNGDGTFTRLTEGSVSTDGGASIGASWGDYDNDADLDLLVTNTSDGLNFLYRNNADGTFSRVLRGELVFELGDFYGSAWADYNNDGALDLFVANNSGPNLLYRGKGDGEFTKITIGVMVTDRHASTGASWGDFDKDGDLDLFVANADSQANALYVNESSDTNWLNMACQGTVSNVSAIGVRVRAKATIRGRPTWQMQEISGQTGFGGQNSLNVEFGLGDAVQVDSLVIEWPSGAAQVFGHLPVNQFVAIVEGESDVTGVRSNTPKQPDTFTLAQNFPNPFNPTTVIKFDLPVEIEVFLRVYNVLGIEIRSLIQRTLPAGAHQVEWDGRDDLGHKVPSGIYFYRIEAGTFRHVRKMTLLR